MFPVQLETKRLLLREYEEGDWPMLHVWEGDAEVVRHKSNEVLSLVQCKAYVEKVLQQARTEPRRLYELMLVTFEDAQVIGKVGLRLDEAEPRVGEVWFTLRRDAQGYGYAQEAMTEFLRFAFDDLKLHRAFGDVDPRNTASWKLLERLGFRREGHLRQNVFLKGEWCDSYLYALLAEQRAATSPSP